jgi:uncharacterized integral membrane protein
LVRTSSHRRLIFLLIFIYNNANKSVKIWVWFGKDEVQTTAMRLIVGMFLAGVVGTLLLRMAYRTLRQIRELLQRGQTKNAADARAKAAMLQTKPDASGGAPSA